MIFSPIYYRSGETFNDCEFLSITSDDGKELEGIVYETVDVKNTLLVFAGRSHDGVALINKLRKSYNNTRIIIFNYRSYGKSRGKINEKNILQDGLKIAELVQKHYGDFYILGFSLGSSVGAYVASKCRIKGLFLIAAFDSIAGLVKTKYKYSVPLLLKYKFETIKFVKNVECDVYLFSSSEDEIVYIQNVHKLKENIKHLYYYEEFESLSHKEVLWEKKVIEKIKERLEQ